MDEIRSNLCKLEKIVTNIQMENFRILPQRKQLKKECADMYKKIFEELLGIINVLSRNMRMNIEGIPISRNVDETQMKYFKSKMLGAIMKLKRVVIPNDSSKADFKSIWKCIDNLCNSVEVIETERKAEAAAIFNQTGLTGQDFEDFLAEMDWSDDEPSNISKDLFANEEDDEFDAEQERLSAEHHAKKNADSRKEERMAAADKQESPTKLGFRLMKKKKIEN